jgi:hypothetical protein
VDFQIHNHRAFETDGQRIIRGKKVLKPVFAPVEMEKSPSFRDFINMNTHGALSPLPVKR